MLADLIVFLFYVSLKCDHHVPTGFSASKLRRNSNTRHTHVEVGVDVDVGVGLIVGSELSWVIDVGLASCWRRVRKFGVGL